MGGLGPTSPSSTRNSSPRSNSEIRSAEDEILSSLAQSALNQIKSMAQNASARGEWTEKKAASANEVVYEHLSSTEFRILVKCVVPCTAAEISNVLSHEDSDQFNASMLDLVGDQFKYGVTVRTVPAMSDPNADSRLALRALSLSNANSFLASSTRTVYCLDYAETDLEGRTACRVMQSLTRTENLETNHQDVTGDSLLGYILHEDPLAKRTTVFFYATHCIRDTEKSASLRKATIQRLRKIAQVSTKWVMIATRRRFGAQKILDPATNSGGTMVVPPAHFCRECAQQFTPLLRKPHCCCLCGHNVCSSCSGVHEVEERVAMVEKLRICVECVTRVRSDAFEPQEAAQRATNCHVTKLQSQAPRRQKVMQSAPRNPFYCVPSDNTKLPESAQSNTMTQQRYSGSTASSSASSRGSYGSNDSSEERRKTTEEGRLADIAHEAMGRVLTAATSRTFAQGVWKERKFTMAETVYEQRTAKEFRVLTRAMVPCTIDEISNVLSSEDSDQLNASLIDILGKQFEYAINIRKIPTTSTRTLHSSLSVKLISFAAPGLHRPLLSRTAKRDVMFLDYVETNHELRTACRVMQPIARTDGLRTKEDALDDTFAGYVLREDPITKHTVVFFYGHHCCVPGRSTGLRAYTIRSLRTMSNVTTKWVDIALRRRLGAQRILRPSSIPSLSLHALSASCFTCDLPFHVLRRKKRFCCLCGHYTCGSCSRAASIEERIGIVLKKHVCLACDDAVGRKAFEASSSKSRTLVQQGRGSDHTHRR
uniref:FYVE-type domain-containing protein n=1 Tax=Globisporangium ultimum (strain ATCC 200006 / CBS 805.95 / DAOM BR144) TaxID=431595 RepID=K3WM21_GLOUD